MRRCMWFTSLTALVCLLSSVAVLGQATATTSLQGIVSDESGAVIVGADITITNTDTGATRRIQTTGTGLYRFDLLPVGTYSLKVMKSGFAAVTRQGFTLQVGQTTTLNIGMKPGTAREVVEVSGEAPIVDQEKTSVGLNVTPQQVENLPLNGRDFANLAYLAPGAKPVDSYDPTKNRIAIFGINGSSGRNVNVTVNGIDNKDNTVGGPVMQFPLGAIEEFVISTQRFSAVNGRSEGAAVNVITKSGTNSYHGSGYFYDTETALNANDHFSKKTGNPTPQFSRQQLGGSIGGPVRQDKDFLFFALERQREHTSSSVGGLISELNLLVPL